jgi:hypothetical protein
MPKSVRICQLLSGDEFYPNAQFDLDGRLPAVASRPNYKETKMANDEAAAAFAEKLKAEFELEGSITVESGKVVYREDDQALVILTDADLIKKARVDYEDEGTLEIDEEPAVSRGANGHGAYVQAWVWVDYPHFTGE